jgi:hypothetical protein
LDEREQDQMDRHIADDPERHPLISGGSGMRKAWWARLGLDKCGGHRHICQEPEGESQ